MSLALILTNLYLTFKLSSLLAQILKIDPLCTPTTSFYTIKFEGKFVSEYTDFNKRLLSDANNKRELDVINAIIKEIGERGALARYFNRDENFAYALPPKLKEYYIQSEDYGIRLYCVVLNEHIVFLLNGDRKKTQKAMDPNSNVSRYFYMANSLYNELVKDKLNKIINWNEADLELDANYLVDVKG